MKRPARYFRAGVGAVIADRRGRVLVFERVDIPGAWQFPQGGMERGEKPIDAVFREIREETGIPRQALKLVRRYPELLAYELPREAQSVKTGLGQVQYWFLFRLKRSVAIDRLPSHSEFKAVAWVRFDRAVACAVSFKKPLYRRLREYFTRALLDESPGVLRPIQKRKHRKG